MLIRILSAVLLSTLVATTSFAVVLPSRPAAAGQISDLKSQAVAISQKLVEQQLQAGAYQQRYSVETGKVADDARLVAQTGQQIAQDREQIDAKSNQVKRQAIKSYMEFGTGSSSSSAALFNGDQETAQAMAEYSNVAVGNITTALDQLRSAQSTLEAHQASLRQQQAEDEADQTQQAAALDQANATERSMASLQATVTGQLAVAVTAQATQQAAAAAAAVAAAQRATVKASPTRTTATSTPTAAPTNTAAPTAGSGSPALTDPVLNPFLQCVVQAESGGNYRINTGNGYYGAFQFSQSTWNFAANAAGLSYLVGVLPSSASKAEQDTVAVALFALDGQRPWLGDICSA